MKTTIIILLLVATMIFSACTPQAPEENIQVPEQPQELTLAEQCEDNQGTWLEEPQECEGISKDVCENLGGNFNECASACRNDPNAEICTMQCVLVCEFKEIIPKDCTSWFDGCNNCMVEDGVIGGCTKMYCEQMQEPKCMKFKE